MYIVSDKKVKEQEDKGRAIFTTTFPLMQWTENENKYGSWDLSGSTANTYNATLAPAKPIEMFAEIKVRNIESTKYPTTFLEQKKYDQLMNLANSTDTGKAFYFVSFADNISFLFDLNNISVKKYADVRWMKEVSMDDQDKIVEKTVYDLPLTTAVKKYKS